MKQNGIMQHCMIQAMLQPYIAAMFQMKAVGCRLKVDNKKEREVFEELHKALPVCAEALLSIQPLRMLCVN